MSKENLEEEQYSDILARATAASGINPDFLEEEAIPYGGI